MDKKPNHIEANQVVKSIQDAKALLPAPYRKLTDEVLDEDNVKLAIKTLKEILDDRGGIHLLDVDEYQVLVRVPSESVINRSIEFSKKRTATESDREFVGECLLYPPQEIFNSWLRQAPGLSTPFARKLFDLAKIQQEAQAKKL